MGVDNLGGQDRVARMSNVTDTPAPLTHSRTGKCKCPDCGAVNQFRSDFTYQVGQWVLGLRCPTCLGASGGQQVIALTTNVSVVARCPYCDAAFHSARPHSCHKCGTADPCDPTKTTTPPAGYTLRSRPEGDSRLTYHPDWDRSRPWIGYVGGTCVAHFANPSDARRESRFRTLETFAEADARIDALRATETDVDAEAGSRYGPRSDGK